MARLHRYELTDVPQHVIQRGNNLHPTFFVDSDFEFYRQCVRDATERYACDIHA